MPEVAGLGLDCVIASCCAAVHNISMTMNEGSRRNAVESPLVPSNPFGPLNEPILLHQGMIEGVTTEARSGRIYLSLDPVPSLRWEVDSEDDDSWTEIGDVRLSFARPSGSATTSGVGNSYGEGSLNGVQIFRPGVRLRRVHFHWMNLPPIQGNIRIVVEGTNWGQNAMAERDRLCVTVGGWEVTLDRRSDYADSVKDARTRSLYVVTHLMEIRRADGSDFEPQELEPLSEALRLGLSFAFGRWVSPAIKVGYNHSDDVVWESWGTPICDPFKRIGSPIIYWGSQVDVAGFIEQVVERFSDSVRYGTVSFQMFLAAQTAELGFVENRIFSAFPALENLSWVSLKLDAGRSNTEYESIGDGAARLRMMLVEASIPLEIPESLPGLRSIGSEKNLDGPAAIVWVRNRLVHPKDPHDTIYSQEHRIVVETWHLSRNYLALLLLNSIGYSGGYLPAVPPFGFLAGPTPVPWTSDIEP